MRPLTLDEFGYGTSESAGASRVLIVEDDTDSREAMSKAMRLLGYDADCAGTFLEGVAKLTSKVRWLILDLGLPDGDGTSLLRYIRRHDLPVRVAVVTGAGDAALLSDTALLKPDAFFTKPVDFRDVARWTSATDHDGGEGFAGTYPPA